MRNATVRAAHDNGPVEVVALDRNEFHALLEESAGTRAHVERVAAERRAANSGAHALS